MFFIFYSPLGHTRHGRGIVVAGPTLPFDKRVERERPRDSQPVPWAEPHLPVCNRIDWYQRRNALVHIYYYYTTILFLNGGIKNTACGRGKRKKIKKKETKKGRCTHTRATNRKFTYAMLIIVGRRRRRQIFDGSRYLYAPES